ncbi:MAG: sigma-70 family RNA polymerase sigma factor [Bacteroidales bacterium]|nr:sigma-70 family RNA polymerase sigma factor [Bacteroidales bacterium]
MTEERFVQLVREEQEVLRRFLLALCGRRELAEDLAQEVLMKAWLACGEYVERYRFSTWLCKIAYRAYVDHLRRQTPPPLPIDDDLTLPADEQADSAFRYEELHQALALLPLKERTAVCLYYLEEQSLREIAIATGSNPIAVKQQLKRGRDHLKKLMKR